MPAVSATLSRFTHTLLTWSARAHERSAMRRELNTMDDSILADFGLSRREAEKLVNKPFWVG